jgi:hypothetical protein
MAQPLPMILAFSRHLVIRLPYSINLNPASSTPIKVIFTAIYGFIVAFVLQRIS